MTPAITPAPGEVHVHQFSLDREETEQARLQRFLSPDELVRADRLRSRLIRNRFVAGRGRLRETLAGYLGLEPGELCLTVGDHGKPNVSAAQGENGLCFNLSHAGDLALLAVSSHCELGIDLEQRQDNLLFQGMARQFFSIREQAELFSLPPELQLTAFYRCWTRKEAYLKGCGSGFSQPANQCDVSLFPGHPPALLENRTNPDESVRWRLLDITVPDGFYAALAVRGI
jgi:4'-phosphopantetheinyl transferase